MKIAIDRGGTFTDVYASLDNDSELAFKLLSVDPANYKDAPVEGIRRVLEHTSGSAIPKGEPLDISSVESIRMGTTVATNGLLERRGARVAFIVTKGFRDILTIGQQSRPDIFDLEVSKLKQLYEHVYEVDERVTLEAFTEDPEYTTNAAKAFTSSVYKGVSGEAVRVIKEPDVPAIRSVLEQIWQSGIRSLAIAFMHGYTYPKHEQLVAKIAREIGFKSISVSSELQPMIKIVSRAASVSADAYLSPLIQRYVETIGNGFKGGLEAVAHKLLFMQSDGGLTPVKQFTGLKAVLSGPAGGVVGYSRTSYDGVPILGFDMGGTSTDVSRFAGNFEHVFETTTAQVTIQAPQLDIQTVAAGGGSILSWRNGLFNVGPESASAHPGPACYRKSGPLTVTDANLLLGRIDVTSFPHIFGPDENLPLDEEVVREKFSQLAEEIGTDLTVEEVALGFLKVSNETMCRPIRSLTEGKGYATAKHVLASFGGAGGQHACAVARTLGIEKIIIHKYSSILSAYGIALADTVVDMQQPASELLNESSLVGLNERLDALSEAATSKLLAQGANPRSIVTERYLNLRYKGSETFMMIQSDPKVQFGDKFATKHLQEFGFTFDRPILVGDIRVRAVSRTPLRTDELLPKSAEGEQVPEGAARPLRTKRLYFDDGWTEGGVYELKDLSPGVVIAGPALILDSTQTILVEPRCSAHIFPNHVVLHVAIRDRPSAVDEASEHIDVVTLSLFGHRFMSIAEQMGHTLQKTAISTNIKERLDFSCAIFDPEGGLVANAPHIPVHLGSMSSAVAYQRQLWKGKLEDGDVLVANHPAFGGSHLPDITVITPVFENGEIIFWAASRGHHSDIGGITAGSMPPFSKALWEEGATIKGMKIVSKGQLDLDSFHRAMVIEPSQHDGCSGSRSYNDSVSDLKAQIAANKKGIELLRSLAEDQTLSVVQKYMLAIQSTAESSVRALLRKVAARNGTELSGIDYLDDGSPIALQVKIDPDSGSAVFDFSGTGPQLYGNLNAPRAITYSAILYCLRTMIKEDIPLNQGCLTPLEIRIPEGCLLNPDAGAAIVGGNVETSQRVTDVVFKTFSAVAGSQGTCNNLTFGYGDRDTPGFGYYETIAGGAGAGPTWEGQSGVQVHMTNTRATDPEVFEKRYPVILHEFSVRSGSGGTGLYKGGDGVVRDIEFRHPVQVSILSERRSRSPYGLNGGDNGASGLNLWLDANHGEKILRSLSGKNTLKMEVGDHIIIKTPGGGGYGSAQRP